MSDSVKVTQSNSVKVTQSNSVKVTQSNSVKVTQSNSVKVTQNNSAQSDDGSGRAMGEEEFVTAKSEFRLGDTLQKFGCKKAYNLPDLFSLARIQSPSMMATGTGCVDALFTSTVCSFWSLTHLFVLVACCSCVASASG